MLPVYQILAVPTVTAITPRIWQDVARDDEAAPYVVWMRQAVVPENNLSDRPPGDRESIRVDVVARDEAERDALTTACRDAVESHGHVLTIQSLGKDADTGYWRMTFDADVFHPR